jgi:hypothetical protein
MTASLGTLNVGPQRIAFKVFPQPASVVDGEPRTPPVVNVRFFRLVTDTAQPPGSELRSYLPPLVPAAQAKLSTLSTPMGVSHAVYTFVADVSFEQPGTWGVEVFVNAPWQAAPAFSTLMFTVRAAGENAVSAPTSWLELSTALTGVAIQVEPTSEQLAAN